MNGFRLPEGNNLRIQFILAEERSGVFVGVRGINEGLGDKGPTVTAFKQWPETYGT